MPKRDTKQPSKKKRRKRRRSEVSTAGGEVLVPKALSDPLRARIVGVATQRPTSPSEFTRQYGKEELSGNYKENLSIVSYHFRILRQHRYLELLEEVPVRGSRRHMYRATRRAVIWDAEWRLLSAAIKAGFREVTLKAFVARAAEAIAAGTFDARDDSNFSWKALMLDEEGWVAFVKVMKRAYDEVIQIEAESAERAATMGALLFAVTFAIAGFVSPEEKQPKAKEKGERKSASGKGKRRKA